MHFSCKIITIGVVVAIAATGACLAETTLGDHPMEQGHMQEMVRKHQGTTPMMGDHTKMQGASTTPVLPGQDAFGAIQEVVHILEADPNTDWSKVDLESLRQHLIDMNEVTLQAEAAPKHIDGLEIAVTGGGRTLAAIWRMIPAWVQMANGHNGWNAKASELPDGELLIVTATNPKEVQHIRGLGFIGLLVTGSWHQPHHLAMAKGEFDHEHLAHPH